MFQTIQAFNGSMEYALRAIEIPFLMLLVRLICTSVLKIIKVNFPLSQTGDLII